MEDEVDANNDNDNNTENTESTNSNDTSQSGALPQLISRLIRYASRVLEDDDDDDSYEQSDHENHWEQVSSNEAAEDFDITLPVSHTYLGTDLEEVRGRTILDEGIYMNLPLLLRENMVLFPGQTLPLAVLSEADISTMEKCIEKNHTFGVVCYNNSFHIERMGTTAEIYEFMQNKPGEPFRIKAKARQRFKILQIKHDMNNEISGNVKILPEIKLPHPYYEYRLRSLDYQRSRCVNDKNEKRQNKLEKLEAMVTSWPAWVYRQYDPNRLASKVREQLQYIETRGSYIPTDPTDLSFWVAQNLPLANQDRLELLKYDCAISRLQWELKYLTKGRNLVCCHCNNVIAKQSDIFPMSREGPQTTFCNSHGFIHDTITVYHAKNLVLDLAPPSSNYSWFPGYAWTIASCKCNRHVGWKFTVETNKTLNPKSFWGLSRMNLKFKILSSGNKNLNDSNEADENKEDSESDSD